MKIFIILSLLLATSVIQAESSSDSCYKCVTSDQNYWPNVKSMKCVPKDFTRKNQIYYDQPYQCPSNTPNRILFQEKLTSNTPITKTLLLDENEIAVVSFSDAIDQPGVWTFLSFDGQNFKVYSKLNQNGDWNAQNSHEVTGEIKLSSKNTDYKFKIVNTGSSK